jgi:hypothetical protein
MYRLIMIALFFIPVAAIAQELNFLSVDSITYKYYLAGDWDNLVETGNKAIEQNIDYKRLRQRLGYAYFYKADYYSAQKQYEKASAFDEYDTDTRLYLYYCGLNTGNEAYARFYAAKLPEDLQKSLDIKAYEPVDAIDFECNYKTNNNATRSNASYIRLGFNTQLGYRFSLYQSASMYTQTIDSALVKQPDYYALLSFSINPHTSLNLAYHYLGTSLESVKYPGNLVYTSLSTKINRTNFGLNGSLLKSDTNNYGQFGLQAGVVLPGKFNIYLNSTVTGMIEKGNNHAIFSQLAGARICKSLWVEGNVTFGNLHNYNDHNALYIYNSPDPPIFRTGSTLFWHATNSLTVTGNYTYDTKHIEFTNSNYNQQSFSGGIIWKL